MITKLKVPVSIYSFYNHKKGSFYPKLVFWEGRKYKTTKIGYHHKYKKGKALIHVFSILAGNIYFKLLHNTENLSWEVEEISDGEVG